METKILICDDSVYELKGIGRIIRENFENVEVVTFDDSVQAMQYLREHSVKILITDIRMAFMDGLSLAKAAKQLNRGIEVILVSAYSEFEYAKVAIQLGVRDYLTKPVEEKILVRLVDNLLNGEKKSEVELTELSLKILEKNRCDVSRISPYTKQIIEIIQNEFSDSGLNLGYFSSVMYLSVGYISTVFKRDCNVSVINFLLNYRMETAKKLLITTSMAVKNVMKETGYDDFSYFCNSFKKYYGVYPTEMRRSDSDEK